MWEVRWYLLDEAASRGIMSEEGGFGMWLRPKRNKDGPALDQLETYKDRGVCSNVGGT